MGKTIKMFVFAMISFMALNVAALIPSFAATYENVMVEGENKGPGMTGWFYEDDAWKYYDFGNNIVGWNEIGGHWYLFDTEGKMLTGWQQTDTGLFYLAENEAENHPVGSCYISEKTPDGSFVDERGNKILDLVVTQARPNPYGVSCVEVDITNQTVYCYINDRLEMYTPCVSGNASNHRTSIGTFKINSKERDRYLRGTNDNGTKYKSWVNYWMPFNGGQGLHDASWRSEFGGDIYTYSGSHGCVNMPYAAAEKLYSLVWVGMPVFIHM